MTHPHADLILNQLTPRVFWSSPDPTTDRPVLGAIAGEHSTLIVDAGNSAAHADAFLRALSARHVSPPRYLFFTHAHWDHIFGATQFPGVVTLAHTSTVAKIKDLSRLKWDDEALEERVRAGVEVEFCRDMIKAELPDRSELVIIAPVVAFDGRIEIDLGGLTCVLEHVGGDHADESTIAYVPSDRVVFVGDSLSGRLYGEGPFYRFHDILRLLNLLLERDAESYVFGHSPQVVSRARMEKWRGLLRMLESSHEGRLDDLQRSLDELVGGVRGQIDLSKIDAALEANNL